MSKNVTEVLAKLKGAESAQEIVTGKGSFSASGFGEFVSAIANDSDYQAVSVDKTGEVKETNIHDLLIGDIKRTIAAAKYPQASEIGTVDTAEISTKGLDKAIPMIITEWLKTGKKFPLAPQKTFTGEVYLQAVPGKVKENVVRDFKTGQTVGTSVTTTKDYVQVRVKSPAPKALQTKVRKDLNGNVISG